MVRNMLHIEYSLSDRPWLRGNPQLQCRYFLVLPCKIAKLLEILANYSETLKVTEYRIEQNRIESLFQHCSKASYIQQHNINFEYIVISQLNFAIYRLRILEKNPQRAVEPNTLCKSQRQFN